MMSLGQTAEATTAHLGKQAAPRPGHLRLPQTWLFMVPVASLAKSNQAVPRPLRSSTLPCATALSLTSRRTRRQGQLLVRNTNLKGGLHRMICS